MLASIHYALHQQRLRRRRGTADMGGEQMSEQEHLSDEFLAALRDHNLVKRLAWVSWYDIDESGHPTRS